VDAVVSDDVHGDVWARGVAADHAVNVATGGPPVWLREVLAEALEQAIAAYPDEREATEVVARRHGRGTEEVVLLNGAAQGFPLLAATLAPRRPVIVHPQFTEPDRALRHLAPRHAILLDPYTLSPDAVPDDADLVVLGNPTNPTGVLHPRVRIEALLRPGRTVVVDEAFMDFVPGEPESLAGIQHDGLVVLRSLTKILAVPGLRIGYALAPAPLAERLRAARPAWSVNALALIAATAATPERLRPIAERAQRDRAALAAALSGVVRVHDGAANFLLAELPPTAPDALTVARLLRNDDNIAIRPAHTFPGLSPHHFRLTARGGEQDARLVAALRRAMG
jgi:histidinol-phosphate aminotransferase